MARPELLVGSAQVVTGGASGIGEGIAEVLARHGARVAVLDRDVENGRRVAGELEGSEREHLAVEVDVGSASAVEAAFASLAADFGPFDGLVNCAGIRIAGGPLELKPEEWQSVIDVNLSGSFYCSREAAKVMVERGSGAMVNIGSAASLVGVDKRVAYNASKAGILGLTRALARDLGGDGIRVNAICPGMIRTPLTEPYFEDEEWTAALGDFIPLGEAGVPEQIGDATAFLLSTMSAYITGIALPVDGGFTSYGSFGSSNSAFTADRKSR